MKIVAVEPILIAVPYEHGGPKPMRAGGAWATMDTLFVRVDTDAGITGWGEAFGFAVSPVTMTAITRIVGPLCVDRDPTNVPALMKDLRRKVQNMGRNGPVGFALSGIDIALWDIAGKVAGQPIHRLLGGSGKIRIPTYASLLRYSAPALVERNAAAAAARGYRHIKLHESTADAVAAARRAVGAEIPLMLDANCAWTPDDAIAMARRLEEYDLTWLEEPVSPPDDYAALARLRKATKIPVAAGENAGNANDINLMTGMGAVDVVQPSVTKIGGIIEMRHAIALAQGRGVRVAPHSPYFGPGLIATLHVIAAMDGDILCERFYCDLQASPLGDAVEARDGYMRVPDRPGLGVDIDMQMIESYRIA